MIGATSRVKVTSGAAVATGHGRQRMAAPIARETTRLRRRIADLYKAQVSRFKYQGSRFKFQVSNPSLPHALGDDTDPFDASACRGVDDADDGLVSQRSGARNEHRLVLPVVVDRPQPVLQLVQHHV